MQLYSDCDRNQLKLFYTSLQLVLQQPLQLADTSLMDIDAYADIRRRISVCPAPGFWCWIHITASY